MDKFPFYIEEQLLAEKVAKIHETSEYLSGALSVIEHISDFDVCQIFCFDDFYSLEIGGEAIAQILYGIETDGKVRDLILRLEIALSGFEGGKVSDEEGLSHGAFSLKNNGCGALLPVEVQPKYDWWNERSMFGSDTVPTVIKGLRGLFVSMGFGHQFLDSYAPLLFPNIYFHVPPSKFKDVGLNYQEYLPRFVTHISYLNDNAMSDFAAESESRVLIGKAGGNGVEMSPESPQTHKNVSAMAERNISIDGVTLCCEWHTKLHHHKGRIHFYPWKHSSENIKKLVKDRVIVGIIAEHLT